MFNAPGGGAITYGGFDMANCGLVIGYQSLSSATYWQFQMQGVSAKSNGGSYTLNQGWEVISDSVVNVIYGPQMILDNLVESIGGIVKYVKGFFEKI